MNDLLSIGLGGCGNKLLNAFMQLDSTKDGIFINSNINEISNNPYIKAPEPQNLQNMNYNQNMNQNIPFMYPFSIAPPNIIVSYFFKSLLLISEISYKFLIVRS